MVEFACPKCRLVNELPEYMAGEPTRCRACGTPGTAYSRTSEMPTAAVATPEPQSLIPTQSTAAFRCPFCGATAPARVEKHITLAGGAILFAVPFVLAAVVGSSGDPLTLLGMLGLCGGLAAAFAGVGLTPRHYCRACKIRLG